MRVRLSMLCCVLSWLVVQEVHADIDPAEYQLKSSVRFGKESQVAKPGV